MDELKDILGEVVFESFQKLEHRALTAGMYNKIASISEKIRTYRVPINGSPCDYFDLTLWMLSDGTKLVTERRVLIYRKDKINLFTEKYAIQKGIYKP